MRVFEAEGFAFVRQRGDHLIYTKAAVKRPLVGDLFDTSPLHAQTAVRLLTEMWPSASVHGERPGGGHADQSLR